MYPMADGVRSSWEPAESNDGSHEAFEVTYVDDDAIHLAASAPKVLMRAIPFLMLHLCRIFSYFGFCINWKPGKTECFLNLRGKHAQLERDKKRANGSAIKLPSDCTSRWLRVVAEYKHLGSCIEWCGSPSPDVPIRVSSPCMNIIQKSGDNQ